MASFSATFLFRAGGQNSRAYAVWRRGHAVDAHPNRVVDGIENCRCRRNHRLLTNPLGSERANRRWILDEDRFNRWHITGRGNQVIMKILALAWEELLHERHSQPLGLSAFN